MSRHTDRIELCTIGIFPVEIHRPAFRIHRIGELPGPVQRLYQGASALCRFFRILIDWMITVGWQLTDRNTCGSSSQRIFASMSFPPNSFLFSLLCYSYDIPLLFLDSSRCNSCQNIFLEENIGQYGRNHNYDDTCCQCLPGSLLCICIVHQESGDGTQFIFGHYTDKEYTCR